MKLVYSLILFITIFHISNANTFSQDILEVIDVSDNLYAIENPQGGNIAFLVTRKGVVVVDAGATPMDGKKIVSTIKSVTKRSIKYVILTHLHGDHINGIAGFPTDVTIISHSDLEENNSKFNKQNLSNYINNIFPKYLTNLKLQLDSIKDTNSPEYEQLMENYNSNVDYFENIKQIKFRKPDITFEDFYRLKLADERIILEYPGPCHTSDNIIVKFSNHNVIHTGDLIFNKSFPYTIEEHGADIYNWVKTLDDLYIENIYTVIPGHGAVDNKYVLKEQSDYFKSLAQKIERLKKQGLSLDEIIAKCDTKDYEFEGNENQFPANITIIYNQLITSKIEWWKF